MDNDSAEEHEEDGQSEAYIEAVGAILRAMDICHEGGVDFEEAVDSARQSWMP